VVICAMAATGLAAGAQAQSGQGDQNPPSLGEIARRLRAEKPATDRAKKVWTNENIPKDPFGISVVGPPAPPPVDTAAQTPPAAPDAAPGKRKSQGELETEMTAAQEKLDTLEKELDLQKRDYALQQQGYYQNPMASQNPQIQATLAQAQQDIDAKQAEVDKLKEHIADLQKQLDDAKKEPAKVPDGAPQN
jgi:type I restriction-modification system DNA methylase subunit